jgi:hypothetical protein
MAELAVKLGFGRTTFSVAKRGSFISLETIFSMPKKGLKSLSLKSSMRLVRACNDFDGLSFNLSKS